MSLSIDGVWNAGVWATTVWAAGVWVEGAAAVVEDRPRGWGGAKYREKYGKKPPTTEEILRSLRKIDDENIPVSAPYMPPPIYIGPEIRAVIPVRHIDRKRKIANAIFLLDS